MMNEKKNNRVKNDRVKYQVKRAEIGLSDLHTIPCSSAALNDDIWFLEQVQYLHPE